MQPPPGEATGYFDGGKVSWEIIYLYFSAHRSGLRCERDAFAQADFHDEQPLCHGHMLCAVSGALLFRAITASKGFSIYSELMLLDPVLCPF